MTQRHSARIVWGTILLCSLLFLGLAPVASAQQAQGTVNVVVFDPTGSIVPGAQLKLVDVVTNTTREATTEDAGTYTFVNLNIGTYKLTVTKSGFDTQLHTVIVQAGRTTDVASKLKVGGSNVTVEVVGTSAPLVETSSSATNMTIDIKQIEDLPLGGRSIAQLSRLSAGYNGTWNGLPTMAQGSSMDGIIAVSGRWKYSSGADGAAVTPRLENIGEMTVSTDQLDLNNGFGTTNMQITYVTRRGTNQFHGRVYEDHRNAALNAGPWNGSTKPALILNEFGGSMGGPILKDKLFFFGSFSMSKQPGGVTGQNVYFTPAAQAGNFVYYGVDSEGGAAAASRSINLLDVVQAYNAAHETSFPTVINPAISSRFNEINAMVQRGDPISGIGDDPLNTSGVSWLQANTTTYYYPTLRLDYNISQNLRLNLAYNQTRYSAPGVNLGWAPGDGRGAGNRNDNLTAALGLEWTISPTLINQFRAGYLYTAAWYGQGGPTDYMNGTPETFWNYGGYEMSGQVFNLPNSRMQPVISISDYFTSVKGRHTLSFGFNAWRDQNKYWDPPEGYDLISLGLAEGDPVLQAFTEQALAVGGYQPTSTELSNAAQIYAILTGRVNSVTGRKAYDPKTGVYSTGVAYSTLNELMKSWGLSFQDSYKVKSNLTLNYGLRWDFVGENRDLTGKYHSMTPADVFGPSGEWNLFNPGVYKPNGTFDPLLQTRSHVYDSWKFTPQPAIGIAWSPRSDGNMFEKLLGGDKTVIRAGYSLRRFTEPQQFVWDMVSAYAAGFYQPFYSYPDFSGSAGTFTPGSVSLDSAGAPTPYPSLSYQPAEYTDTIHLANSTFGDVYFGGIDPHIRQPYTQSWNIGFQRELGPTRALEVRYNGSRTIHQWIAQNINEVNIFENGFLPEFRHAQSNLAIFKQMVDANCGQSGHVACNFGNSGLTGQMDLPIMAASNVNFANAGFVTNLVNGAAGAMAGTLTGRDYFCNMVGSSFSPCGTGYGAGAGYPVNFWMANPYATGGWMGSPYMNDRGFANYNALQAEFRQRSEHGLTYTANYTWSKTLGVATAGDWMGGYRQNTIRDILSSYGPANTDRNHVIHVNATYDLPFGKGKQWLNSNAIVDKVLGNWTVSTIFTWQTGAPFRLAGANQTFNNMLDGGITLNGITSSDLQNHVGVYKSDTPGVVNYLDPEWIGDMKANGSISSNTDPGTIGQQIYLHGPRATFTDIGISKAFDITERVKFKFQSEMLNAFNHPTFQYSNASVASSSFGRATTYSNIWYAPRRIEFRANIEF